MRYGDGAHGLLIPDAMERHDDRTGWRKMAATLRLVGSEAAAVTRVALTMPVGLFRNDTRFDPKSFHPTPVVLVHGLLGDPTNFGALERALSRRGVRNVACFSYRPRLDYQSLAARLAERIEDVCGTTRAPRVDVVGHSLGGLVARYLVETGRGHQVRRLVTLGAPYVGRPNPPQELAIFAAGDFLVPAPAADDAVVRRMTVVPKCGHIGLLYHPMAVESVVSYLTRPAVVT